MSHKKEEVKWSLVKARLEKTVSLYKGKAHELSKEAEEISEEADRKIEKALKRVDEILSE